MLTEGVGGGRGEPEVTDIKMKKIIQIMNMSVQGNEFSKLKRMMLSSVQLGVQKIKFSSS